MILGEFFGKHGPGWSQHNISNLVRVFPCWEGRGGVCRGVQKATKGVHGTWFDHEF